FNEVSLASLVHHNPSLSVLRLSEIGRFTGESLKYLYPLKGKLRSLDISRLGTPQGTVLEDDEVIELLKEVGGELDDLCLDGNVNLTERVLVEGIKPHCPHLRKLSLSDLGEIEPWGFETLFSDKVVEKPSSEEAGATTEQAEGNAQAQGDAAVVTETEASEGSASSVPTVSTSTTAPLDSPRWSSPGLTHLNLHRVSHLTSESLVPLLSHSGSSLVHLSLHSLDELSSEFLFSLADRCPNLRVLDLSFVRSVDNFVVDRIWNKCRKIECLFVHGNNRVTAEVPRKKDAQLRGLENAIHSEVPGVVTWES
ncbi:hypothetical protein JCM10212_004657, partial [Sporobolomyces blumeae]